MKADAERFGLYDVTGRLGGNKDLDAIDSEGLTQENWKINETKEIRKQVIDEC
jgi:hypothetical protein